MGAVVIAQPLRIRPSKLHACSLCAHGAGIGRGSNGGWENRWPYQSRRRLCPQLTGNRCASASPHRQFRNWTKIAHTPRWIWRLVCTNSLVAPESNVFRMFHRRQKDDVMREKLGRAVRLLPEYWQRTDRYVTKRPGESRVYGVRSLGAVRQGPRCLERSKFCRL
jgi:hypothetical protein